MGGKGRLDELVPGVGAGRWAIRAGSDRQFRGESPSLGG
jgi:transposase